MKHLKKIHFHMNYYIFQPSATPPKYLEIYKRYNVNIEILSDIFSRNMEKQFDVLDANTWPSAEELGLNSSQYEAYKLALTHEFTIIQGPPGTGKTFLAIKIAETLLNNLPQLNVVNKCKILVICYTNHALDQFLEAIFHITRSIIRIGGQSRSEQMKKLNISQYRDQITNIKKNRLYFERKQELRLSFNAIRREQMKLDEINNGVVDYNTMCVYLPQLKVLSKYYNDNDGDVLNQWLFESLSTDSHLYDSDLDDEELENLTTVETKVDRDNIFKRDEVDLDELDNDDLSTLSKLNMSFSLTETVEKIKAISAFCKNQKGAQNILFLQTEIRYLKRLVNLYQVSIIYLK